MLKTRIPQITVEIELRMEAAVAHGAADVERDAKAAVPVATGRLRDKIHAEREPEGTYVLAGDDEVWYGHLVEYGTVRTAPKPFLVPSLEMNRDPIVARARRMLGGL